MSLKRGRKQQGWPCAPGAMTMAKSAPSLAASLVNSIVSLVELALVPTMSGMFFKAESASRTSLVADTTALRSSRERCTAVRVQRQCCPVCPCSFCKTLTFTR